MGDSTIFEQDGKVYIALSHAMPPKDLATETAKAIRGMRYIKGARMRVVSAEELRSMPLSSPDCSCRYCKRAKRRGL